MSGLFGDWAKAIRGIKDFASRSEKAFDMTSRDEAFLLQKTVVTGFAKQGIGASWPALSGMTLEMRRNASKIGGQTSRGRKALVRTGALRRSVKVIRASKGVYTVGVHRGARSKQGKPLANIAIIQERGARIRVSNKMRKFFMFLFIKGVINRPLSRRKTSIVIPPRPFMAPAVKLWRKGLVQRATKRYIAYLEGKGRQRIPV